MEEQGGKEMNIFRLNVEHNRVYVRERRSPFRSLFFAREPRRGTTGSRVPQSIGDPVIIPRWGTPWKGERGIKAAMNNHREYLKVKQTPNHASLDD